MQWFTAFWEISTERRFPQGPIPRSAIDAWPVDPSERSLFVACMRAADAAYLDFLSKPAEERASPKPLEPGFLRKKLGK
jgi:hypothetical protein